MTPFKFAVKGFTTMIIAHPDGGADTVGAGNSTHAPMKTKTNLTLIALALFWALPLAAQNPASEPVTLFQNVRIFDGKSGTLSAPSHLLVRGNKIEKISTTPLPVDRKADTVIIDGGGRTLMPGLIDMHWHAMLVRPTPSSA